MARVPHPMKLAAEGASRSALIFPSRRSWASATASIKWRRGAVTIFTLANGRITGIGWDSRDRSRNTLRVSMFCMASSSHNATFFITTARSGTQWLCETLRKVYPELVVEHEPIQYAYAPKRCLRNAAALAALRGEPVVRQHLNDI